ncbi:TPA: hypothetical protein ACSCYS_004262 [Aeromonas veronii]
MANFDTELERLVETAQSIAASLRLKAAAIDEVAKKIAKSKDPSDAAHVVELVQATISNAKVDHLFQQAIRVARAERD